MEKIAVLFFFLISALTFLGGYLIGHSSGFKEGHSCGFKTYQEIYAGYLKTGKSSKFLKDIVEGNVNVGGGKEGGMK